MVLFCTDQPTELANSMQLSPFEELQFVQLLKNFPKFYGTQKFIIMFITDLHQHTNLHDNKIPVTF
jgi:hypothetical protein